MAVEMWVNEGLGVCLALEAKGSQARDHCYFDC